MVARRAWLDWLDDGAKLELRPDAASVDKLFDLLAESVTTLPRRPAVAAHRGSAKARLRIAQDGTLVGKVALRFKATVGGETVRGTYVANLRGA